VLLVSAFAALGLILASLGIYGVISYSVTRQTPEIGIRKALGATAAKVQLGVIQKTLRLALAGITVGTVVFSRSFEGDRLAALRNPTHRPGDVRRRDRRFVRRGPGGRIHLGSPRLAHRPHDRVAHELRMASSVAMPRIVTRGEEGGPRACT